jgi:hypothetical protein
VVSFFGEASGHVSFDLLFLNLALYAGYLLESPGHAC